MRGDLPKIIVLGIGSTFHGDDGIGPYVVERLKCKNSFPENVEIYDGGATGMMGLLPLIEEADHLIVIDAVRMRNEEIGVTKKFSLDEFRMVIPKKLSAHDVGLLECLTIADINDRLPESVTIIGINPGETKNLSQNLSEPVLAKISQIELLVVEELEKLGATVFGG